MANKLFEQAKTSGKKSQSDLCSKRPQPIYNSNCKYWSQTKPSLLALISTTLAYEHSAFQLRLHLNHYPRYTTQAQLSKCDQQKP